MRKEFLIYRKENVKRKLKKYNIDGENMYTIFKLNLIKNDLQFWYHTQDKFVIYVDDYNFPIQVNLGNNKFISLSKQNNLKRGLSFVRDKENINHSCLHQQLIAFQESLNSDSEYIY